MTFQQQIRDKAKDGIESFTVGIVMLTVFLPVRLLVYNVFSQEMSFSVGAVSAITVIMLYLAKKGKLGWFGRAYIRQLFKAVRKKRKWILFTSIGLFTFIMGSFVIAIDHADKNLQSQKDEVKSLLPNKSIENVQDETFDLSPKQIISGFAAMFYLVFFEFDTYATAIGVLDDLMDGWLAHFSVVFFIEQLEVIGILIYNRFAIKESDVENL